MELAYKPMIDKLNIYDGIQDDPSLCNVPGAERERDSAETNMLADRCMPRSSRAVFCCGKHAVVDGAVA